MYLSRTSFFLLLTSICLFTACGVIQKGPSNGEIKDMIKLDLEEGNMSIDFLERLIFKEDNRIEFIGMEDFTRGDWDETEQSLKFKCVVLMETHFNKKKDKEPKEYRLTYKGEVKKDEYGGWKLEGGLDGD